MKLFQRLIWATTSWWKDTSDLIIYSVIRFINSDCKWKYQQACLMISFFHTNWFWIIYYDHFVTICIWELLSTLKMSGCLLFLVQTPRSNTLITMHLLRQQGCSNSLCFGRLSVLMLYILHCEWCAVSWSSAAWSYSHPLILHWSMWWHMVPELLCGGRGIDQWYACK